MNPEYQYFFHTVRFLFLKLALKYLSLQMMDEAVFLAIKTNQPEIISYCKAMAHHRKDVIALNMLEFHEQQVQGATAPKQASWVRSLT